MPATQDRFEEQAKTIVYDLVDKLSGLANTARKNDLGLLIEPNAFNSHLAAITAAHRQAVTEAVRTAYEAAQRIVLDATGIPADAKNPTRDEFVIWGERIAGAIANLSPTTEEK